MLSTKPGYARALLRRALASLAGMALVPAAAFAQVPPQLVGEWNVGSVSMLQYVNPLTHEYRPSAISGKTYEFRPDGTYSYVMVMELGRAPCVNKAFNYEEGTFAAKGGSITFNAKKHLSSVTGCINSPESDKGPFSKTEQWSVGADPSYPKRIMLKIGTATFFRK